MNAHNSLLPLALLTLAACDGDFSGLNGDGPRFIKELPEGVTSIAAPFQNLEQVVLLPEDNCYWYNHAGPVETTLIPLRTTQGRPICASAPEAAPEQ